MIIPRSKLRGMIKLKEGQATVKDHADYQQYQNEHRDQLIGTEFFQLYCKVSAYARVFEISSVHKKISVPRSD